MPSADFSILRQRPLCGRSNMVWRAHFFALVLVEPLNVVHGCWQVLLSSRCALTTSMLCESSHGRTDIGDDDQLLSGMNTTLHLCLASLSHVAYRRSQELLANRGNLNTSLLCASSQVTKDLCVDVQMWSGAHCWQVLFSSRCALTSTGRVGLRRCKKIGVDDQVGSGVYTPAH